MIDYSFEHIFTKPRTKKITYVENIPEHLYKKLLKRENSAKLISWAKELPWAKSAAPYFNLKRARQVLNESHYSLTDVKERVLKYLASVKFAKKDANTPILCLVGAPGIGKTSILYSVAKALKREMISFSPSIAGSALALMGSTDATAPNAEPGAIIKEFTNLKTNNPLLLFDEIDKLNLAHNDSAYATLLNIFDKQTNATFTDNYLQIPFNLSGCLIVATANDENEIPPILKDRLEIINLPNYTLQEKIHIARFFLLKQIYKSYYGLKKAFLNFTDEALSVLIKEYTFESGVRQLKRLLSQITETYLLKAATDEKFFKLTITERNLSKWLKNVPKIKYLSPENKHAGAVKTIHFLANQSVLNTIETTKIVNGGEDVEKVNFIQDNSALKTAFLKLKSAFAQLGYFFTDELIINLVENYAQFEAKDELALAASILSVYEDTPITPELTFAATLNLNGDLLHLDAKTLKPLIAATVEHNFKAIILPRANKNDLKLVPNYLQKAIKIYFCANLKEFCRLMLKQLYDSEQNLITTEKHKIVSQSSSQNSLPKFTNTDNSATKTELNKKKVPGVDDETEDFSNYPPKEEDTQLSTWTEITYNNNNDD